MKSVFLVVPAFLIAGTALAQQDRRSPLDPKAKVPAAEYRSALEGYRPFTEQDLADWRRSNDQVGAAGGHAGLLRGPGTRESANGPAEKPAAPRRHGGHK
jgi:hypothetical protein